MPTPLATPSPRDTFRTGPRRWSIAKSGVAMIAIGLAADVIAHALGPHPDHAAVAGFAVGEHVAHLIALVGMVLVLVGIVADGVRAAGRERRPEGDSRDAVR